MPSRLNGRSRLLFLSAPFTGGSSNEGHKGLMYQDTRPIRPNRATALNEGLAEWFCWFSSAAVPEDLVSVVEQLEAAWRQSSESAPAPATEP
jgi:hypothetical protein